MRAFLNLSAHDARINIDLLSRHPKLSKIIIGLEKSVSIFPSHGITSNTGQRRSVTIFVLKMHRHYIKGACTKRALVVLYDYVCCSAVHGYSSVADLGGRAPPPTDPNFFNFTGFFRKHD